MVSSGSTRGIYVVLLLLRMLTLELFISHTMNAIIRLFFMLGCIIMCLLVNYLLVFPDNEHTFLDMEEKLSKYFPKDWKQDLGKVR